MIITDEMVEAAARSDAEFDGQVWTVMPKGQRSRYAYRARLALTAALASVWKPTHRHKTRGSDYAVIGQASLQASKPVVEGDTLTVYLAEDGTLWVRPQHEFEDGRFEPLPPPPTETEASK